MFPKAEPYCSQWIVAIKGDVGPHFRVSLNPVVCSVHFVEADFFLLSRPMMVNSQSVVDLNETLCRLDLLFGVMYHRDLLHRIANSPPIFVRQQSVTGPTVPTSPKTIEQTLEDEMVDARKRMLELERSNAGLRAENNILRSQLFRYDNVKTDGSQLLFITGLSPNMYF